MLSLMFISYCYVRRSVTASSVPLRFGFLSSYFTAALARVKLPSRCAIFLEFPTRYRQRLVLSTVPIKYFAFAHQRRRAESLDFEPRCQVL